MNEVASRTNPTVVPDHADPNTGLGSGGSDEMSLIAGGLEAIRVTEVAGNFVIQYFGVVTYPTGSAGQASVGFDGDEDTGLFSPGNDSVALTAGGVEGVRYTEIGSHVIQRNENHTGLTASVTQTQAGGLALLSSYNEVATVATTGDALTAPAVVAGNRLLVINNGANSLQLFPAVGDDIGAGVDTAINIAAGELGVFLGRDATNWDTLYNGSSSPGTTFPLLAPNGSAAAPSYSWSTDSATGFYLQSAANMNVTVNGINRWEFTTSLGGTFQADIASGPLLINRASTAAFPNICPDRADTASGMGYNASGPALLANGVRAVSYKATGGFETVQINDADVGLTASTTQTQGNGVLTNSYNEVATVANPNDTVTAPPVEEGHRLIIINNGANVLQVFPAAVDNIGAGVDTSITIAVGELGVFFGRDATNWDTLYNASPTPTGIANGTTTNATLRWSGAAWVENISVQTTVAGVLLTNSLDSLGASTINVGGMDETDPGLNLEDGMSLRFEDRAQTNDFFIQNQGIGAVGPVLYLDGPATGIFTIGDGIGFRIEDAGNTDWVQMAHNGTHFTMGGVNTDGLRIEYPIFIDEEASAQADLAGYGQFWVRNDTPNTAMFTNDAGVDKALVNDAAQARRTTVYTLTTAFVDITMDVTDIETDSAVVDHDLATNTDNIILGQAGFYECTYDFDVICTAVSGDPIIDMGCRVRLNDAGTGINGSLANPYVFRDGSVGGDNGQFQVHVSNTFIFQAAAADFITLQLDKTELSGTATFNASKICVKVRRLL